MDSCTNSCRFISLSLLNPSPPSPLGHFSNEHSVALSRGIILVDVILVKVGVARGSLNHLRSRVQVNDVYVYILLLSVFDD